MRAVAAKLVRMGHYLVFVFLIIGWALPWWQAWLVHLPLTLVTRIHWRLNHRRCIFTTWEVLLKGEEFVDDHEEGWFVKEVFENVTGWRPSTTFVRRLMMAWMYSAALLSGIRLWLYFV
ncbi:MAG TPA: DUF2784 family protein [Candidatus Thalassarchaeaceae archaeon]|nr:DUF2784 family protein [Candidatus Thalassarchaeaceae archaeon]HJL59791.1 DUF2784 family protein [Candidatus Thalassarchaeaceae archaeon]